MKQYLIASLFFPIFSFGQSYITEKFINDALNENNYLIFNSDSTFKYRLSYHLFHDISCGRYKIVNDTIFLSYNTDLRVTSCNKEIDAQTHFDSSVLGFRQTKLFYKGDRLYKIEGRRIIYKTEKYQPDWKIGKSSRKYYRRKYLLFGPLVRKTKNTHYMVATSKLKWHN